MSEKAGKGTIAEKDIGIQTTALKIPADFQAENPRDNSQSSITMNCFSNILVSLLSYKLT